VGTSQRVRVLMLMVMVTDDGDRWVMDVVLLLVVDAVGMQTDLDGR